MNDRSNLIIGKESLVLRLFKPRPAPEPGIAFVLFRDGLPLVTIWPGDRLTSGEIVWGKYKTIYKVDITEHSISFNRDIPCYGDAFNFHAQVNLTYSVGDPSLIVKRNVSNINSLLEQIIEKKMREISRKNDLEKSAETESLINESLPIEIKKHNTGLKLIYCFVTICLDEIEKNHLKQLQQIDHKKEAEKKLAELNVQLFTQESGLTKMKMDFYGPLIKEGQWQMLALQLSAHPEDIKSIYQLVSQQKQLDLENQLKALKLMLDGDVIEKGYHLDKVGRGVLQKLVESFGNGLDSNLLGSANEINNSTPKLPEKTSDKK
jgi:hypothetical protein